MQKLNIWLTENQKTVWNGTDELWLDPLGNEAKTSDCSLTVEPRKIIYRWNYEGDEKTGSFLFSESGVVWEDSWHQTEPVNCDNIPDSWSLFAIRYTFEAPPGPDWGWRMLLSERPDNSLVLQMINIAPWGEEARAVRMVFQKENT